MVVLGEDGKKGDQPSQVNRSIRTDSTYETASQLTSIDPYVIRNDSPAAESSSRELEGSDERSPLLPPAYRDDRAQGGDVGRQSPPISGTAKPPSRRVCGTLPSWLQFTTRTLFKFAVGLVLLIVVAIIAIPKIIKHGRETGTWPEQPGQPNNPNTPDEPDNSGGRGSGNGAIPWDNNGRAVAWNASWGSKVIFDKLESHPFRCDGFSTPEPISTENYNRFSSISTFRLPLSAQTLFFHTKAGPLSGKINVLTRSEIGKVMELQVPGLDLGKDKEGEGVLLVQAVFGMGREKDWEGFHVCQAGDGDESAGVFLMNDDPWRKSTLGFQLEWHIYLVLPSSHPHSPLSLNNLDLTGVNMRIEFYPQAGENTRFDQVELKTTNGKIHIPSINAKGLSLQSTNSAIVVDRVKAGLMQGFIGTTNGPIVCADCCPSPEERPRSWNLITSNSGIAGNYCAKESIRVKTSTGSIAADFEAPNVDVQTTNGKVVGKYRGIREWLRVGSTNGMMDAEVGFWDDDQNSLDPAGKERIRHIPVAIETTNSHVDVTLANLPVNIEMYAQVQTTNGQLRFYGNENFQGEVLATTSNARRIILDNLNKVRQWSVRFARGYVRGTIGEKGGVWGKISLETTNSDIEGSI